ncbi:GFA family protein [Shewanella gelidimarina]|uniref:GFA family protein n=1 Tax=Shewanella gelidimarina TaxID=56813 RepID=UPI00200EF548|nr:GFA family protein [Shewanella gelidimarina]MCL1059140.1 GFA family protein [Shewanella gelidimarina]
MTIEGLQLGGCLCGAIRYQITAAPFSADFCHCRQCQKSTGSVLGAWMDFNIDEVCWLVGSVTEFNSSEFVRRGFCHHCGSQLTFRDTRHPSYLTLSIVSLDEPNAVQPSYHIHTNSQLQWLALNDTCVKYPQSRS